MSVLESFLRDRKRAIETLIKIRTRRHGVQPLRFNRTQNLYWPERSTHDLIPKSRQLGVSTIITAEFLLDAVTIEGINVGHVWQGEEEGYAHMANMIKPMYEALPEYLEIGGEHVKFKPRVEISNRSTITFPELGSSITVGPAGSEKAWRGRTWHRVHFAEPAFYPPGTFDIMHAAMVGAAPKGQIKTSYGHIAPSFRVVGESTARGRGGKWYELVQGALHNRNLYKVHFFPFFLEDEIVLDPDDLKRFKLDGEILWTPDEHRIAQIAKAKYNLDLTDDHIRLRRFNQLSLPSMWKQEFAEDLDSSFLTPGGMVFEAGKLGLLSAHAERVPVISTGYNGALRRWEEAIVGEDYLISADPSDGLYNKEDSAFAAAVVIRVGTWTHVATLIGKFPPSDFGDKLVQLAKEYNNAMIAPELNNNCGGSTIMQIVSVNGYDNVYRQPDPISGKRGTFGWRTHRGNKVPMIDNAKEIIEKGGFHTYDPSLISQLYNLIHTANSIDGVPGSFVDLAMATVIGINVLLDKNAPLKALTRKAKVSRRY